MEQFVDLYNILGIPPTSPPNLVYLAINKLENALWSNYSQISARPNYNQDIEVYLAMAQEKLLKPLSIRRAYDEEWESYYFPNDGKQTNIEQFCKRSTESNFLTSGLRYKNLPLLEPPPATDSFDYQKDFTYFIMRDFPKERDIFFLDTAQEVKLPPFNDTIVFEGKKFYFHSSGSIKASITNDAIGKAIIVEDSKASVPLNIGDRIEFANGIRLILRSIYSLIPENKGSIENQFSFYFERERVSLVLNPQKIYVLGRNTSDIRHLHFNEDIFCFINIGRRDRSISRQNSQVFYHKGNWYIQDLGSRYGTTIEFEKHPKFETLTSGSIMQLEKGCIRLGYEKFYIIEVNTSSTVKSIGRKTRSMPVVSENASPISIYDIPVIY